MDLISSSRPIGLAVFASSPNQLTKRPQTIMCCNSICVIVLMPPKPVSQCPHGQQSSEFPNSHSSKAITSTTSRRDFAPGLHAGSSVAMLLPFMMTSHFCRNFMWRLGGKLTLSATANTFRYPEPRTCQCRAVHPHMKQLQRVAACAFASN